MSVLRLGMLAAVLFPFCASASITIRFESDAVVASGVTRGGKVIATSFERLPIGEQHSANRVLADDDGDGEVRIVLPERACDRSVWIFVDLQSGEHAEGMPGGAIERTDFRGGGLKNGAPGQVNRLLHTASTRLLLLVVRPNEGAWGLRASDGGGTDRDRGHNGTIEIDSEDFTPLRGFGPPPKTFRKDDVVVGVDPFSLRVFALKVGK